MVTFVVGSKKFAYPVVIEPGQELKLIKKLNIDESGGVFVEPGYLTLAASPYANVFVDGDLVGATPIFKHPLAPGRHTIKAVTADGKTQTIVVTVESGRESTHRLSW